MELPSNKSERLIKIHPVVDVILTLNCTQTITKIIMTGGGSISNIMVEWLLLVIKVDGTFDDSQQTVTNSTDGYIIVLYVHVLLDISLYHT